MVAKEHHFESLKITQSIKLARVLHLVGYGVQIRRWLVKEWRLVLCDDWVVQGHVPWCDTTLSDFLKHFKNIWTTLMGLWMLTNSPLKGWACACRDFVGSHKESPQDWALPCGAPLKSQGHQTDGHGRGEWHYTWRGLQQWGTGRLLANGSYCCCKMLITSTLAKGISVFSAQVLLHHRVQWNSVKQRQLSNEQITIQNTNY